MPKKKTKKAAATAAGPLTPSYVRDRKVLGKDAETREERRAVLAAALVNEWSTDDIVAIERIDQDGWHGWAMWT